MRTTTLTLSIFIFFLGINLRAQEEGAWESYIVKHEKGPMAITVNMDFDLTRPNYKNLLIIGTHTTKCYKNGYPKEEGLEKLYAMSDSIAYIVDGLTKNRLAGIITYQCTGFDIFYVKDTTNLRENIATFFKNNYSNSKNYLKIETDRRWKYYQDSLFPKNLKEDFFINHEFLNQLVIDGDDLSEERKVDHWIYFRKEKRRQKFIDKVGVLNFVVDSIRLKKGRNSPYELKISRKDKIDPESIEELTAIIKSLALSFYGIYEGWGAALVTKD